MQFSSIRPAFILPFTFSFRLFFGSLCFSSFPIVSSSFCLYSHFMVYAREVNLKDPWVNLYFWSKAITRELGQFFAVVLSSSFWIETHPLYGFSKIELANFQTLYRLFMIISNKCCSNRRTYHGSVTFPPGQFRK